MSASWTLFVRRFLARCAGRRDGTAAPSDTRKAQEDPETDPGKDDNADTVDGPMQLSLAQVETFKVHVQALDRLVIQADAVNTAALSIALARLVHTGEGDATALLDEIVTLRDRAAEEGTLRPESKPVMDGLIALTTALEADVRAAMPGER